MREKDRMTLRLFFLDSVDVSKGLSESGVGERWREKEGLRKRGWEVDFQA